MKNDKIVDAYDAIEFTDAAKSRMLEKVKQKAKKNNKRPVFRTAISLAATAAVIMFALFGNMPWNQSDSNSFFIIAYSMETQKDGTVELREVDIDFINQYGSWGGFFDGEQLFRNIALGVVGENIQSVEFRTDVGFFAKQYIVRENGLIVVPRGIPMVFTTEGNIALFGDDFEMIGSRFTLQAEDITEDLLLFIGEEWDNTTRPSDIVIIATATFNDGTIQEESITIIFEGRMGKILGPISDRVPEFPAEDVPVIEQPREPNESVAEWTREELELRKQRFIVQGIEVPQELLDLLAELD